MNIFFYWLTSSWLCSYQMYYRDVWCTGLVFLQYRNETKRALLPNEITSIDTVKALFVRSFPKQLTMEYLDSPHVKIYIHDSSKDMFYELEDLRFVTIFSLLVLHFNVTCLVSFLVSVNLQQWHLLLVGDSNWLHHEKSLIQGGSNVNGIEFLGHSTLK